MTLLVGLFGFVLGFNLANLMHWRLLLRVQSLRADLKAINTTLMNVQVEHARIERALILAQHEARGEPPALRQ